VFVGNRPKTEAGQITLTVGQTSGDLRGFDDRVLQAVVDYVSGLGGGRVDVCDGVYEMQNALFL
jgi:polygalacturonase